MIVLCSQCGSEMKRFKCEIHDVMFCSKPCKSEWMKVNSRGENALHYINGKKDVVCEVCDLVFKVFNKEKFRKFCSAACYGKHLKTLRGENTSNWKGGDRSEGRYSVEYKVWRNNVFIRDNHTCKKCNVRGGILHAHHIYSYSKHESLRLSLSNGITLCEKCHNIFHKTFSKTECDMDDLNIFIGEEFAFHDEIEWVK